MNGNPKSRFEAKGLLREALSDAPVSLLRVVILADDAAGTENLPPQAMKCIQTQSAYEAAAEILAEPTAALLLDLRRVGHRHLRLLQVARDCGVEIFAVGTIPSGLSSEDLSGVRLTARSDVQDRLSHLAPPPKATSAKSQKDLESPMEKFSEPGDLEFPNPSPTEIPPEMEEGRYISEEIGEADLEAMLSEMPNPQEDLGVRESYEGTPAISEEKQNIPAVPAQSRLASGGAASSTGTLGLLTPEELSALLENGS